MKSSAFLATAGLALGLLGSSIAMSQETQAVGPYKDFKGTIKLDIRDSKADWGPFTPKKAPAGAPNILFVLYDDTGLSEIGRASCRERVCTVV
jgi:arylsulfatase